MREDLKARIIDKLVGYGVDSVENQGLHGWRCRYPEAYGPCDCFETLVEELTQAAFMTAVDASSSEMTHMAQMTREANRGS